MHEGGYRRHNQHANKRHTDTQAPAGVQSGFGKLQLGGFNFTQNTAATFKKHTTLGGQSYATRAAVKQADAQSFFQPGDTFTYR